MVSSLVLGTAQLGMPYGINRQATPSDIEAQAIVREAVAAGVKWIDTARAYGTAEANVGSALESFTAHDCRVVTKLSPFNGLAQSDDSEVIVALAAQSMQDSMAALKVGSLDTVLLHRWSHWDAWDGALAGFLMEKLDDGVISKLGASVQSPAELRSALRVPAISHIQMPINILDDRWGSILPELLEARTRREMVVHVRSVLLQGLLLSKETAKWLRAHVKQPERYLIWLADAAQKHAGGEITQLCVNWARSLDWVDGIVVGVDDVSQLRSNVNIFTRPPFAGRAYRELLASRPVLPESALNPANWR